jgi:hypothetical protein
MLFSKTCIRRWKLMVMNSLVDKITKLLFIVCTLILIPSVTERFSSTIATKTTLRETLSLVPTRRDTYADLYSWLEILTQKLNNPTLNPYFPLGFKLGYACSGGRYNFTSSALLPTSGIEMRTGDPVSSSQYVPRSAQLYGTYGNLESDLSLIITKTDRMNPDSISWLRANQW